MNYMSGHCRPRLNRVAVQYGWAISYEVSETGPRHSPRWTAIVFLNNIQYGPGVATSKGGAKETAARMALESLGLIGPHYPVCNPLMICLAADLPSPSPRLASPRLQLIRRDDAERPSFHVNDFNVHVPFERCTSWEDLCAFLIERLRGQNGSDFVKSGNFGLLAPEESELFSRDTWDPLVPQRKPNMALDLYAVITDDSDRCPKCLNPVTHPWQDNLQRCAVIECQFTFLVVYREAEITRPAENPPSVGIADQPAYITPPSVSPSAVSSAVQSLSVPPRVQVIRRRPFRADLEDAPPIPQSTEQVTTSAPGKKTPETFYNFLELLRVMYIFLFLGLPDRYSQEAPKDGDGTGRNSCQHWINEWTYVGTGALAICGLLVAILQISSAGNDPIVHTLALLSLICLFAGAAYAVILIMTFGRLETDADRRGWIRAAREMPKNPFWTPWILLAMPLAWISWGIIYAVLLVGAFIWRDGTTNEPDESSRLLPHQAYGPKTVEFLVYVVGLGYFGLIVKTVRGIGLKRTVVPDTEAIPMLVVSTD